MTYKMIKDDDLAPMNNQYLDINPHSHPHTAYEALFRADAELTAKDAEIARLRLALQPFAYVADEFYDEDAEMSVLTVGIAFSPKRVLIKDLKLARACLDSVE